MFDRQKLNSDPRCKRATKLDRPAAQFSGGRILGVLRRI
jgi:hypothetical protein